MNSIANAMKEAGVDVPPLIRRLWLWIKDHPKATAREIEDQFKEIVTPRLADMEARQMLRSEPVPNPSRKGKRTLKGYTVTQTEYDLLPLSKKEPMTTKVPAIVPVQVPLAPGKINLDLLTIGEARELYRQLQAFFK